MSDFIRNTNVAGNLATIAGAIPIFEFGAYLKKHAKTSEEKAAAKSYSKMMKATIIVTLISVAAMLISLFWGLTSMDDGSVTEIMAALIVTGIVTVGLIIFGVIGRKTFGKDFRVFINKCTCENCKSVVKDLSAANKTWECSKCRYINERK